jgi:hypothetical protein
VPECPPAVPTKGSTDVSDNSSKQTGELQAALGRAAKLLATDAPAAEAQIQLILNAAPAILRRC